MDGPVVFKACWIVYQSDYTGDWHICFRTRDGRFPREEDRHIGPERAVAEAEADRLNDAFR